MMMNGTKRLGLSLSDFWSLTLVEYFDMMEACSKYEDTQNATVGIFTALAMNGKNPLDLLKDKQKPVMIGEAGKVHKPNNAAAFMF